MDDAGAEAGASAGETALQRRGELTAAQKARSVVRPRVQRFWDARSFASNTATLPTDASSWGFCFMVNVCMRQTANGGGQRNRGMPAALAASLAALMSVGDSDSEAVVAVSTRVLTWDT